MTDVSMEEFGVATLILLAVVACHLYLASLHNYLKEAISIPDVCPKTLLLRVTSVHDMKWFEMKVTI
jgi:hypothetical protein